MLIRWWTVKGIGPWSVARMVPSWQAALSYIYQLPRKAHFVEVTLDDETRHYERGANYSWRRVTQEVSYGHCGE